MDYFYAHPSRVVVAVLILTELIEAIFIYMTHKKNKELEIRYHKLVKLLNGHAKDIL